MTEPARLSARAVDAAGRHWRAAPPAAARGRRAPVALFTLLLACLVVALVSAAEATRAAGADAVTFDAPSATALLGSPLAMRTSFHSPVAPLRVELLTHLPTATAVRVGLATVTRGSNDAYEASVSDTGHVLPNSSIGYRFRVTLPDGSTAIGPEATATVVDPRFEWRTLEGDVVRLHWYDGDDAFARRAVQIGDDAIHGAEQLLGVKEQQKVDFFIYASEAPFRDALGPGTRENVGGQAVAAIRTLFGLIDPSQINSDWVDILVTHELTHLVFNTAVDNPFHLPPRWLNEGLAVYRSQGYDAGSKAQVEQAARDGSIIPLDGLTGLFPTGAGFALGYAEAVSAVAYIVDTYGQDALVTLIRSYAAGRTDDEAFTTAIGRDSATVGADWLASLGGVTPQPLGPQPALPGPLPPGWTSAVRLASIDGSATVALLRSR